MPTGTEFLPFATAISANVEPQTDFSGSAHQLVGFNDGIALPTQANKVWRQSSIMSAALANYISDVLQQTVPDDGNLNKLIAAFWQALLGGGYFVDSGSSGAMSVASPGGLTFGAPFAGLRVSILTAASCPGPTTLNWCGTGSQPIVYLDDFPLLSGAYSAGTIIDLAHDGTHWRFMSGGSGVLRSSGLGAGPTIYVRTDGNDAHDGSANTSGKAVATLAQAYRLATRYYVPGGGVTIQLGIPGSYASATIPAMASALIVRGDPAAQTSYIIHGAGANNISASSGNINISLIGLLINNDDITNNTLTVANGGSIALDHVSLGAAGFSNSTAAIVAFPGGSVTMAAGITVNSNYGIFLAANGGAITLQAGGSMAAAGGPAFSDVTVSASDGGVAALTGTISGAAAGVRYRATTNSVIDTSGKGASGIFGGSPGSVSTGGQYV